MLAMLRALNAKREMKEHDDATVLSSQLSRERESSYQELLMH